MELAIPDEHLFSYRAGEIKNICRMLSGKQLKGRDQLGDVDVDGRIILKCILKN
jgi:hypothetical protein